MASIFSRLIPLLGRRRGVNLSAQVRDAFALAQYRSLAAQVPLGYMALMPIALGAFWLGMPGAPLLQRLGLPGVIWLFSLLRLVVWLRRPSTIDDPKRARRIVWGSGVISTLLAGTGGIWCTLSWLHAPPHIAAYFPLFLTMAVLTPVFAQAMNAASGYANLAAGLGPMVVVMLLSGDAQARLGAALIIASAVFLVNMLLQQRRRFTDLLQLEYAMREEAKTDPLTGLVNRRALGDRFATMVAEVRAGHDADPDKRPALIQIDLDGFKPVNDAHGHATGDLVLREVANRLRRAVGKGALVCRMGGDEFAVLAMSSTGDNAEDARTTESQAQRLRLAMTAPFEIEGHRLDVGASIGYAQWPQDGRSLAELSATADRRLYSDKANRRLARGTTRPVLVARS